MKNKPRWSRLNAQDNPLHAQAMDDLVQSLNENDLELLKSALERYPQAATKTQLGPFQNNPVRSATISGLTPTQAALRQGWNKALPILHQAGVEFKAADLRLAVAHNKIAGINTLMGLGGVWQDEKGCALGWLTSSKIAADPLENARKTRNVLTKAGMHTGQFCQHHCFPRQAAWTVLDAWLYRGEAQLALDALADTSSRPLWAYEDPALFWQSFAQGWVGAQGGVSKLGLHPIENWMDIARMAQTQGLVLGQKALVIITEHALVALDLKLDIPGQSVAWSQVKLNQFSIYLQKLSEVIAPDEQARALSAVGQILLSSYTAHLDAVQKATWQACVLEESPHSNHVISRPRL